MKTLTKQWLQKLLPKWDYFCPKCNSQIEKNTHKCPHCGEQFPFNFAVKAPSKLLKDKQKLSFYVHERIFPSLSQAHRDYLAKYFTVIFSSGFEDTNHTEWSSWSASGTGSITIQSTQKYSGNNALLATCDNGGYAEADYDFTQATEMYSRCYVKINAFPNSTGRTRILSMLRAGEADVIWFGMQNTGSTYHWFLMMNDDGAFTYFYSTSVPELNKWYCVELYYKMGTGNSDGIGKVYIDGVETLSYTTNTSTWQITNTSVGATSVGGDNANGSVYVDCVKIADAYIGLEPFEDDFESGDFSKWTTITGTPTVQGSVVESGSYAMAVAMPSTNTENSARVDIAGNPTVFFARTYVRFERLPDAYKGVSIAYLGLDGNSIQVIVRNDGTNYKWVFYDGTDLTEYTEAIATDTWYCIEIKYDADADSEILYRDGTPIITRSATRTEAVQYLKFGFIQNTWGVGWSDTASNTYFDSVVCSQTYIGPHVLFENGFEEGDFSAWSFNYNNPTVQTAIKHEGTYAAQCTSATHGQFGKSGLSNSDLYTRFYVYITDLPTNNGDYNYFFAFSNGVHWICQTVIDKSSDNTRIRLDVYYPSEVTYATNYAFQTNTWYCIETRYCSHASSGIYQVWVNGELQINQTGLDTSSGGTVSQVWLGSIWSTYTVTNYFDDVVVADAYIGPEPGSALQTVTDTLTLTENVAHDKGINAGIFPQVPDLSVGAQDKFFGQVYAADGSFNTLKTVSGDGEISICNSAVPATASLYLGTPEHPWVEGTILDVFTKKIQIRQSGDINHTFVSPEDYAPGEGGIVEIENVMVQDPAAAEPEHNYRSLLKIDKPLSSIEVNGYCDFKDTGLALNVHLDPATGGWVEEELAIPPDFKPTYNVAKLWCTTVNPTDRTTSIGDPVLQTSFAFRVEKDLQTFGFVGTSSDPQKQRGGGAIMMGQGFLKDGCPPIFDLTGTLLIKSVAEALLTYPNGTHESRPDDTGSRAKYYQTDDYYQPVYPYQLLEPAGLYEDTPLYNDNNQIIGHEWQFRGTAEAIGSYPTYNTGKYWYDSATKCLKYGNTVAAPYVESGKYDTLFLISGETLTYSPFVLANLYCGRVTAVNGVFVKDGLETDGLVISNDTDSCAVGINLLGEEPNQYYGIESNGLPWQFDQAVTCGGGLSVTGLLGVTQSITTYTQFISTLATGTKPIDVASTTMCNNLNADMLDGHHWSEVSAGQWTAGAVTSVDSPLTISSGHLQIGAGSLSGLINFIAGIQFNSDTKMIWVNNNAVAIQDENGNTNNGILDVGYVYCNVLASLSTTLTLGAALSANGSVGSAGQVLKSRGANLTPEWGDSAWNGGTVTNDVTITKANAMLKVNAAAGKVVFSNDITLIRDNGNLRVQTATGNGLIVEQNLWCNELVTDNASIDPAGDIDGHDITASNGLYGDHLNVTSQIQCQSGNIRSNGNDWIVAGNIYVGGIEIYNSGGAFRCASSLATDSYIYVGAFSSGSIACYIDAYNRLSTYSSSLRHKTNIKTLLDASWIYDLRPVEFDWKDTERAKYDGRMLGLIAEEVAQLEPKLVWKNKKGEIEGIHYEWIAVPMLVEIKKLKSEEKALAQKQDKQDEMLLKLLDMTEQQAQEITDLHLQIDALKKTNGGENA